MKNFSHLLSLFCIINIIFATLVQVSYAGESKDSIAKENPIITQTNNWEELLDGISYIYLDEYVSFNNEKLSSSQSSVDFGNENIVEKDTELERTIPSGTHFKLHLVKIDPNKFQFNLFGNFLEDKNTNYTLPVWSKEKDLLVAINASMYLTDNTTSTGYMRSYAEYNNDYIAQAMSGFFLAQHKKSELPATFTEVNSAKNWKEQLDEYNVVIQNFRIIGDYDSSNESAQVLWNKTTQRVPVAAYGIDVDGYIFFIFSQNPTTVNELALYLLSLKNKDIVFTNVLYAEGGREAALYIQTPKKTFYINGLGSSALDFLSPVPNVLGITHK